MTQGAVLLWQQQLLQQRKPGLVLQRSTGEQKQQLLPRCRRYQVQQLPVQQGLCWQKGCSCLTAKAKAVLQALLRVAAAQPVPVPARTQLRLLRGFSRLMTALWI